jgi:uncharacterized protein (DUF305 family)
MEMNNKTALIVVALIVGAIAGYYFGSSKGGEHIMSDGSAMKDTDAMSHIMEDMSASLRGKTGDAFDREFLIEMITHHEGAVNMAEMTLQSAKHEELKSLARDIIDAQTKEISLMKGWLKQWYGI